MPDAGVGCKRQIADFRIRQPFNDPGAPAKAFLQPKPERPGHGLSGLSRKCGGSGHDSKSCRLRRACRPVVPELTPEHHFEREKPVL
jgi:hypothetical protein